MEWKTRVNVEQAYILIFSVNFCTVKNEPFEY
jgi:hypothetical protein